ncbi:hypothetical protein CGCA056_v013701 [Colletotrichum aenigma]|uniref:uncharacterized protein n=1 Tax=Colletotrichum aenigma TaxID=1215731 RepID=UPI001872DE90|nr:uncharacterized protein CGCA056_v013701 [Colletotrichum aenigma]KAF5507260.1 hypothetical protein CGCA056_v013701 [Colletotrichum aenigma]
MYKNTIMLALTADTAEQPEFNRLCQSLNDIKCSNGSKTLTPLPYITEHKTTMNLHGGAPSSKDLLIAIERELEHFNEVYITVDAIDESNPREDFLTVIRHLATDARFKKIRLLLTSREYFDIETVMTEFSTSISMKNEFLDADIRLYTESRLRNEKHVRNWPAQLQQETVEALSNGAQGMFRWVVCQIDALRRMRNREAVRKALDRLPKTLDEAYDRIFEQIEEEDFPYFNSAMKWLCFEAKLHTGEAACVDVQTLAQAVDEDICGDNPEGELFYDPQSLREICGCLVTVTPTTLKNGQQRYYISFAHYTVLEYLASSKRHKFDPFFTLEKDGLVLEKAERIFARALCVRDDEYKEYRAVAWTSDGEHYRISNLPNFGSYCAFTSIDILICFDSLFSKHSGLLYRVLDVLDTRKHRCRLLFSIWSNRAKALESNDFSFSREAETDYQNSGLLHNIKWETMPDLEIQVLVRLLIFGCVHMARALLETMKPQATFQVQLDFKYHYCYSRGSMDTEWDWHFQGSLTDCFATLFPATTLTYRWPGNINVFKLLIEVGAGSFDPQGALLPFSPLHEHSDDCGDWCVLKKLLSLGANPNASRCFVTPLQIAVATFDVEGVLALLQAGANPNAEGCATASAWPDDKLLSNFNCLNGWRPLRICNHISDPEMFNDLKAWSVDITDKAEEEAETNRSSIEAILLEYGAED